jgi:3-oxoacyl-[acyl-carrier protein] reductase
MNTSQPVVLVTGASTGIGRALAKAFAADGAQIALVARSAQGLADTREAIISEGGIAEAFQCDLRDLSRMDELRESVTSRLGCPSVLLHVAGVWHDDTHVFAGVDLVDTPAQQIIDVIQVGLLAPMLLTRVFLPEMIKHRRGKIISISGTFSNGGAGWLHYYVSKLSLEHFTVGLAQELRPHHIQVNCISPSDTATEALKRFFPDDATTALEPADIATLALFLASGHAEHITGQTIVIKSSRA